MRKTSRRAGSAASAIVGAALAALLVPLLPAAGNADWLVTREGVRVETKGPWKVKGKLVVFTRPDDTLASLRLAEVDLEASERATAAPAARRPPSAPEKPREKKWVLTDSSFPRKPEAPSASSPSGEPQVPAAVSPEGEKAVPGKSPVTVASWRQAASTEKEGIEILGVLQNNGEHLAEQVTLTVELVDLNGTLLGTSTAVLSAPNIRPGGGVTFRATFPGVFAFAEARFDIRNQRLMEAPPPAPTGQTTP
jgi:hypothetical protein